MVPTLDDAKLVIRILVERDRQFDDLGWVGFRSNPPGGDPPHPDPLLRAAEDVDELAVARHAGHMAGPEPQHVAAWGRGIGNRDRHMVTVSTRVEQVGSGAGERLLDVIRERRHAAPAEDPKESLGLVRKPEFLDRPLRAGFPRGVPLGRGQFVGLLGFGRAMLPGNHLAALGLDPLALRFRPFADPRGIAERLTGDREVAADLVARQIER